MFRAVKQAGFSENDRFSKVGISNYWLHQRVELDLAVAEHEILVPHYHWLARNLRWKLELIIRAV